MSKTAEFPELSVLNQISHVLVHQRNVSALLKEVLDIIHYQMKVDRATLTLRRGDYLYIEASNGLTEEEKKRGKYKVGEGITGKVAASPRSVAAS